MSDIEKLRAVGRAATEGPWRVVYGNEIHAGGQREVMSAEMDDDSMYGPSAVLRLGDADAKFIATARNEWDALLDEVVALRSKVARVEALATSWTEADGEPATGSDLTALTVANRHGRMLLDALTTPDPTERVRGEGGGRHG